MADAVGNPAEAELFIRYAEPQQAILDSMASDPPRMPPPSDVSPQVYEDIRSLLIERCDIDIDPSDLRPLEAGSPFPSPLTE